MLSLEVTTKCNLRCKNCFAHADGTELNDMDFDLAVDVLVEGLELGYRELSITGGEPFLWSRTLELLDYAADLGYNKFFLNSNCHLLTPELCSELKRYGDRLEISSTVNGYKEEHEEVRGKGSYEQVLTGIKNGVEAGLNIFVYTVVNRRNLSTLPKFTEWLFKEYEGIKSLVFIQLRGIDDDYYNITDLKLEPEDFIEFVRTTGYLALAGYPIFILENSLSTVVANKLGLSWLPGSPEISRDGKIVVLQSKVITDNHSSLTNLGLYKKGELSRVLSSAEYRDVTVKESDSCLGCKYIKCCRDSGKLRPSDDFHNTGHRGSFYCQKVLELIDG